jgi:signal transduction histidine kinase
MLAFFINPIVAKAALPLFLALVAFVLGVLLIRNLRKQVGTTESAQPLRVGGESTPASTLAAYEGVIRKMKEQERELERLRNLERSRATASELLSASVISNLSSGVVVFNKSGVVRSANESAKNILGFASPIGLHARDLFRGVKQVRLQSGESSPGVNALLTGLECSLGDGISVRRIEADYQTPQNREKVLGITISAVRTANEVHAAACLVSDLTEITDMSRQMRLKENMASLGEMSAGIAHEFKNSLATVSGYAQMIQRAVDPERMREFSGKIAEETAALTRIVTDFLNFSRPQGFGAEKVELRSMLQESARELQLDLALDQFPRYLQTIGDSTALHQVFRNLLRNSKEAARPGVRPRVEAIGKKERDTIHIVLRDNGCGIPADQLSKVFIPFFTTKTSGTGLGLALVHRIITEHGGTVSVSSDDSGTTFSIALPAQKPA